MKITNNFIKFTTAAAVIATTSGCVKKPYREMPKDSIPQGVEQKVDSLSKSSQRILNDTTYKYYGKDTLHLRMMPDGTTTSVNELQDQINKIAKSNDERVVIGSYTAMIPMYNGKSTTYYPQVRHHYADKHMNQKAVVKDAKIFTTDSTDMYIPVEYYGQINPKTLKK